MSDPDDLDERYPDEDMKEGKTYLERQYRLFGGEDHLQTILDDLDEMDAGYDYDEEEEL